MLMTMIYFGKGYKVYSAKRHSGEKSWGNQAQACQSLLPGVPRVFTGACSHRHPLPGLYQNSKFLPPSHCLYSLVYIISLRKPLKIQVFRHQPRASLRSKTSFLPSPSFSFLPSPSSCAGSSSLPPGSLQLGAQLPCSVWDLNSLTWD